MHMVRGGTSAVKRGVYNVNNISTAQTTPTTPIQLWCAVSARYFYNEVQIPFKNWVRNGDIKLPLIILILPDDLNRYLTGFGSIESAAGPRKDILYKNPPLFLCII